MHMLLSMHVYVYVFILNELLHLRNKCLFFVCAWTGLPGCVPESASAGSEGSAGAGDCGGGSGVL